DQARETTVDRVVVPTQVDEDIVAVPARVQVPLPGIHTVAPGVERQPVHRLAEGAIGVAPMHAQFDEHTRFQQLDSEEREGNVLVPGTNFSQPAWRIEQDGRRSCLRQCVPLAVAACRSTNRRPPPRPTPCQWPWSPSTKP